ncbi:MAG TPA: SGNH/GDSL hydrolase family protein [Candidatus Eremiobacteraceae bacterium]|nr:SGNH/GDSL hydrolase family protein [Candidatus Eremiobacteraceae bacterium]
MSQRISQLVRRTLAGFIVLTVCLASVGGRKSYFAPTALAQAQDWEPSIRQFEEQDKVNPPKLGGVVFTGSSSIARWETLANDMKPLDVINRGFGGSEYSDLNQYAKRIVIAYRPRAVVVYEGDNDLAAGSSKSPESVANDAREFVKIVRSALPETWIYIVSIKPSPSRLHEWPRMKAANGMNRDFARTQPRVQYIDVASAMFDTQGNLPDDLFVEDGLHPTRKCYALWTSIIKPILLQQGVAAPASAREIAVPQTRN